MFKRCNVQGSIIWFRICLCLPKPLDNCAGRCLLSVVDAISVMSFIVKPYQGLVLCNNSTKPSSFAMHSFLSDLSSLFEHAGGSLQKDVAPTRWSSLLLAGVSDGRGWDSTIPACRSVGRGLHPSIHMDGQLEKDVTLSSRSLGGRTV